MYSVCVFEIFAFNCMMYSVCLKFNFQLGVCVCLKFKFQLYIMLTVDGMFVWLCFCCSSVLFVGLTMDRYIYTISTKLICLLFFYLP